MVDLTRVTCLYGIRCDVYWNINKGLYSVKALQDCPVYDVRKGVVAWHTYHLTMQDVRFVVQPAGRERVRREGIKNVHAFVRGTVCIPFLPFEYPSAKVRYNPFKNDTFVAIPSEEPIYTADYVLLDTLIGNPPSQRAIPSIYAYASGATFHEHLNRHPRLPKTKEEKVNE